eukprot:1640947-Prymnesium_polylepis.1
MHHHRTTAPHARQSPTELTIIALQPRRERAQVPLNPHATAADARARAASRVGAPDARRCGRTPRSRQPSRLFSSLPSR